MTRKNSHRLLVLWSALAAAGGCGQILGISDYEVDPKLGIGGISAGGEGAHAGDPSSAGQPGVAGEGGVPPVVVTMGGAGAGGEAGTPGVGGARPLEKFSGCDGTPFEGNDAILRSCILRVGCLQWLWPTETISRCVSQNAQNVYEGTRCTLDAETCDDITACEGKHVESSFCGTGANAKKGMHCNGDEIVDCDGFVPFARDCAKEGATCKDFGVGVDLDGNGSNVACKLPLPLDACTATTDVEACSGTEYSYQCYGTDAYGSNCTSFAAGCRSVDGDIGCYYPLNACTSEGVTCSNDRATWCDGTSKVTFDCGSVGLGCATSGDYSEDGERQCLAPGCTPEDVATCQESCDGSSLTLCYGGAPLTVDCKEYGFETCAAYEYECQDGDAVNDCIASSDVISFAQCE